MRNAGSHVKALRAKGEEPIRLTIRNPCSELTSITLQGKRLADLEIVEFGPLNDNPEPLARVDLDVCFGKGDSPFLEICRKVEVEIEIGRHRYRDVLYPDTRERRFRYRVIYEDTMPGLIYCEECDDVVIARSDGGCGQHG